MLINHINIICLRLPMLNAWYMMKKQLLESKERKPWNGTNKNLAGDEKHKVHTLLMSLNRWCLRVVLKMPIEDDFFSFFKRLFLNQGPYKSKQQFLCSYDLLKSCSRICAELSTPDYWIQYQQGTSFHFSDNQDCSFRSAASHQLEQKTKTKMETKSTGRDWIQWIYLLKIMTNVRLWLRFTIPELQPYIEEMELLQSKLICHDCSLSTFFIKYIGVLGWAAFSKDFRRDFV